MAFNILANLVVLIHLAFVVFAVLGAVLVLKWPKIAWLHIPAAAWAALIQFGGWICPLTPLENQLRVRGGATAYSGGFIEHYILPVLYPANLTRELQLILGILVLVINLLIYTYVFRSHNKRKCANP